VPKNTLYALILKMKKPMDLVHYIKENTRKPNKEMNPDFLPSPCPALRKKNAPSARKTLLPLLAKETKEIINPRERMIDNAMPSNK
jgi:hypothetical protein